MRKIPSKRKEKKTNLIKFINLKLKSCVCFLIENFPNWKLVCCFQIRPFWIHCNIFRTIINFNTTDRLNHFVYIFFLWNFIIFFFKTFPIFVEMRMKIHLIFFYCTFIDIQSNSFIACRWLFKKCQLNIRMANYFFSTI